MTLHPDSDIEPGSTALRDGRRSLSETAPLMLLVFACLGLVTGCVSWWWGDGTVATWIWAAATAPVVAALAVSIARQMIDGRFGVDAIAFVSMSAALLLGQPLAGIVVAIMYSGGTTLEEMAVGRAKRDLKHLVDRAPRIAYRMTESNVVKVSVGQVSPGDRLFVRAGDIVPVDGVVETATAFLDESALTGEPRPLRRSTGDAVRSGAVNAGDAFVIQARARANESAYAAIVRMVEAAQAAKAPFIRMADRFAVILFPLTIAVAGFAWWWSGEPLRGLSVMVVATPCPLIIAAPVAFIAGVSKAARSGILMKGGTPLETLARIKTAIFDKTGTLTAGGARFLAFRVAPGADGEETLRLLASLEQASHHPLAATIVGEGQRRGLVLARPHSVSEVRGAGLSGRVGDEVVKAGSWALVGGNSPPPCWASTAMEEAKALSALTVFVSRGGRLEAACLLGDETRPEGPTVMARLRALGVNRLLMVTGDHADAADAVGAMFDFDKITSGCTPADKLAIIHDEMLRAPVAMIGDGINDAPALAAATVGIAMGARGASASSEAADVVILLEDLGKVADAVAIARHTRAIALQSIIVGLSLSGVAMIFATAGFITPVAGALLQEAIDLAVILNALRALGGMPRREAIEASHPTNRFDPRRRLRRVSCTSPIARAIAIAARGISGSSRTKRYSRPFFPRRP